MPFIMEQRAQLEFALKHVEMHQATLHQQNANYIKPFVFVQDPFSPSGILQVRNLTKCEIIGYLIGISHKKQHL